VDILREIGTKGAQIRPVILSGRSTRRRVPVKATYEPKPVTPDKEVIAYWRIGERSSHTWFVLKYLLRYPNVRNYHGSRTERGNLKDVDREVRFPPFLPQESGNGNKLRSPRISNPRRMPTPKGQWRRLRANADHRSLP